MKKNKEKLTYIHVYPMNHSLVIFLSNNFENIHKCLNKKENKKISDFLKARCPEIHIPDNSANGCLVFNKETNQPLILFINNKKKDWEFYNTIIHEVNHAVEYWADYCGFQDEKEFKAYLMEHVFTRVRQALL